MTSGTDEPYEPQTPEARRLAADLEEQRLLDARRVEEVNEEQRRRLSDAQDRREERR